MNGGDLTRSTFRSHRHYSGVRMQQGRVQLDADWNEQLDLTAHRDRAEALDVIGPVGVPKIDGGFELTVSPDGKDLLISPGRAWVAGRLCEVEAGTIATDEVSNTSIMVDSLLVAGVELRSHHWVEVIDQDQSVVSRISAVDVAARTLTLESSIGALSGAIRLRRLSSYAHQPDLPDPAHTVRASSTTPNLLDLAEGNYFAYLDVWERPITALDDPTISEPALGVETATRSKVVWQVRLLDLAGVAEPVGCESDLSTALADLVPPTGLMAARAEPPAGSEDLCRPTPAGGYVGLENQLYRVHVHEVVSGRPVILWSRENASVVTPWVSTIASDVLGVAGIGRDTILGFQPGDWVELYDDGRVLDRQPGTLVRLLNAKDDRLTLDPATATGSTDIADFPHHPQIRRWDSAGPVASTPDTWLALENGVEVLFPLGGTYRPHDYWLVPARSVTADVDWPRDSAGTPSTQPAAGIRHDFGRLGIVTRTASGLEFTDCRNRFPSLTALTADDVGVNNDVCDLPGVDTVQDALDSLCRANDMRRHNRLLHGHGIVCGLVVHCGDDDGGGDDASAERRTKSGFTTADRRELFDSDDGAARASAERRFVTVQPGSAINVDGVDLDVPAPIVVDVLAEVEALGEDVLDKSGDGEISLVLRNDPDRGPVVAATTYEPPEKWSFLDGTLINDIYQDCIADLFGWIKAQFRAPNSDDEDQGGYLLRSALINLLTYVANPRSGSSVIVSKNEHQRLVKFYEGLKKRLRSQTFCALFDEARPYPDYPEPLGGIRTIAGTGLHSRARMHPSGKEIWTTGGGINPIKPSTMINRYSLTKERLVARLDPLAGRTIARGDKGSETVAAVTDVAFSPDGKLIYVAVPTRDGNDTLFRVGEIDDQDVKWRPATTICGVKLVTLATTAADPENVYAIGVRRRSTEGKALSLRDFTGAGLWRIPSKEVPEGLAAIKGTETLNTIGQLVISPAGEAVFTVGQDGGTADRYSRLIAMQVSPRGQTVLSDVQLDGTGDSDLALVLKSRKLDRATAWVVSGTGNPKVAAYEVETGQLHAQLPLQEVGPTKGPLSLQAVNDRILVTDPSTSLARVLDASRQEIVETLLLPVQVAPTSITARPSEPRHVVVLNLVSNSLSAIDVELVMGESFDLAPLVAYRRAAVEAFVDLVAGFAQYLKDCICDRLLITCPPRVENKDLDLAAVSIRGGSVYKVCNFSRRRYVKSFPTVGYWLSLVPVLPALREVLGRACCAVLPELFGGYSTKGHDDAGDRVNPTQVLAFLEIAQREDPMSRLRNLDWGALSGFLQGANSGDWSEQRHPSPSVASASRESAQPDSEPATVADSRGPILAETVLSNLLRNPMIRRDPTTQFAGDADLAVGRGSRVTDRGESDQLAALLARVESLETELGALRTTTSSSRTGKSKPDQ